MSNNSNLAELASSLKLVDKNAQEKFISEIKTYIDEKTSALEQRIALLEQRNS